MRVPTVRPMILFYLMIGYVIASYLWWMVLLLQKNTETYEERLHALVERYEHAGLEPSRMKDSGEYNDIVSRYEAQRSMVIGEGMVFLFIIVIIGWQLLRGFNKEIELNRSQRNFLLSITHELRSPIASVKLSMQTLERKRDLPVDTTTRLLNNALTDVDRLHTLVENLLLSAKIESDAFETHNEPIDLSALVKDTSTKLSDTLGRDREFQLDIQPGLLVSGDYNALVSVVNNLVENAIKYSPLESPIRLTLQEKGAEIMLAIADEGYGIPDVERRKIFRKFYRVGNEDTRRAKGTGLGLYIVDHIVALHSGRIEVHTNAPKGTVFEIKLPKLNAPV
jgi:signal transduction histidine kinase